MTRSRRPAARAAILLAGVAAAVVPGGCASEPAAGRAEVALLSTQQEIEMGRRTLQEVLATVGEYPDPQLQAYVAGVGRRLAAVSERPDLPWTFTVLDDPSINAFALPGGFVYLTRGSLALMASEAELASVLGHQIGHAAARHEAGRLGRAEIADLGLTAGTFLSSGLGGGGGGTGAGLGVLFLAFDRDDERQADDLALRYLERAGYDPHPMVAVLQSLERASQGSPTGRLPSWLSTHPDPTDRLARLQAAIEAEPRELLGTTVTREAFLARIDGLVYGDDPRRGFFEGATFYDPRLAFRITFPAGWQTGHVIGSAGAVSPRRDAALAVTAAGGDSPAEAARRFFAQRGVERIGPWRDTIGGLPAVAGAFRAERGPSAAVSGLVAFVAVGDRGDRIVQLLGYSLAERSARFRDQLASSLESFAPLSDPRYLDVEPRRIALVKLTSETTLEELQRAHPSAVPLDTLALLNRLEPGGSLPAGARAKIVTGPEVP